MHDIDFPLQLFDDPGLVRTAVHYATTSAIFTQHGSVVLDDELTGIAPLVAGFLVGQGEKLDIEDIVSSLPPDTDERTRVVTRAVAEACIDPDADLLGHLVDCAERGVGVDLPARSPLWAFVLSNDAGATIAAGLARDAACSVLQPDLEPLTSAGRAVAALFPAFAGREDYAPQIHM